jgi:hypothetical protein
MQFRLLQVRPPQVCPREYGCLQICTAEVKAAQAVFAAKFSPMKSYLILLFTSENGWRSKSRKTMCKVRDLGLQCGDRIPDIIGAMKIG